jgi:hypothetical protein
MADMEARLDKKARKETGPTAFLLYTGKQIQQAP